MRRSLKIFNGKHTFLPKMLGYEFDRQFVFLVLLMVVCVNILHGLSDEHFSYSASHLNISVRAHVEIGLNSSNKNVSYHHEKQVPWEVFQFMICSSMFLIGSIGNAMVVLTIIQNKSMHNLQNYFVFSLAITDLVTLLIILPLNLMAKYVAWPFGEFTCKYILPIGDVVPAVSILTLVSISIDRYRAIIHALSKKPSLTTGIGLIVFIWLLSYVIIGLPLTFAFKVRPGFWVSKSCYTQWPSTHFHLVYSILRSIFSYVVPSIIIFHCYVRVNGALGRNLKFLARSVSGLAQVIRLKRQRHVMRMFFAIFITFVVCFLPLHLATLLYVLSADVESWIYAGEMFQLTTIFAFANSVCNPIILYKLSRGYRESFQRNLPFLKRCGSSLDEFHDTEKNLEDADGKVCENFNRLRFRRSTKESNVSFLNSPKMASGQTHADKTSHGGSDDENEDRKSVLLKNSSPASRPSSNLLQVN